MKQSISLPEFYRVLLSTFYIGVLLDCLSAKNYKYHKIRYDCHAKTKQPADIDLPIFFFGQIPILSFAKFPKGIISKVLILEFIIC